VLVIVCPRYPATESFAARSRRTPHAAALVVVGGAIYLCQTDRRPVAAFVGGPYICVKLIDDRSRRCGVALAWGSWYEIRRSDMTTQPKHSRTTEPKSRAKLVPPGRLPVSEFAIDRAGAASPFGDDITFPVPADRLTYEHPESND
jgi:hypothetical protein